MPTYGLVNPQNGVDRWENNIDPNVATRSGWRWLPLVVDAMPSVPRFATIASADVVEANQIRRTWAVTQHAPTSADVTAERDRRLQTFTFNGAVYDFGGDSTVNIAGAGSLALAAIINGAQPGNLRWANPSRDFVWIASDNSSVTMDAQTCFAFAQAAATWKASHILAARAIKDMTPIPADYDANARWPS